MGALSGLSCLQASDIDQYFTSTSGDDTTRKEWERTEETPGILLGVRVKGSWTKALNEYASQLGNDIGSFTQHSPIAPSSANSPLSLPRALAPVPVQVMFDGPYGGCTLELPNYERVLLLAGGSGATFAVGMLDELVASRCLSERKLGVRTNMVGFVWCTRSFGVFPQYYFVLS
jgi:ferric-chelate reductase